MQSRSTSRSTSSILVAFGLATLVFAGWLTAQEAPRPPADWQLSGDADRARPTFQKYCATCHGVEGRGDGVMSEYIDPQPKDLTDREYMDTHTDYEIYLAIKKGGAEVGLSDKMAPWESLLAEQEIRDLTLLVRELSRKP